MTYSFSISGVSYRGANVDDVRFELTMTPEEVRENINILTDLLKKLPEIVDGIKQTQQS